MCVCECVCVRARVMNEQNEAEKSYEYISHIIAGVY